MAKRVLILCTGNSCRSQLAEALWRDLGDGNWEAMREIGLDLSQARSKHVSTFAGQHFDLVLTVCGHARDACPVFPASQSLHWPFDDPATAIGSHEEQRHAFRRVRDETAVAIRAYLEKAG